jgi:hypothetical protein
MLFNDFIGEQIMYGRTSGTPFGKFHTFSHNQLGELFSVVNAHPFAAGIRASLLH